MHCNCNLRHRCSRSAAFAAFSSVRLETRVSTEDRPCLLLMDTRMASTRLINKLKELQDVLAQLQGEKCAADVRTRKAQQVDIPLGSVQCV